jgi:class 3 adenylate cyclase
VCPLYRKSRLDASRSNAAACLVSALGQDEGGLAVAGVPDERPDHAEAGAEMALGIVEVLSARTGSNDDLVEVRIGVASGPAVADVIGRRQFTCDLWATR